MKTRVPKQEKNSRTLLSSIRTSKLVKKGTLGLSALLAAVTIEAASPFLESIINQNQSAAYAADNREIRYESGFLYAIGEGCSQGTPNILGKTTIEEATIKAIRDAFEDLGVVYRVDKRELTTKEQIRRETGKQVTSIWTQETIDKFTTSYPNSYSINRYLYDPEEYYAAYHLEACVRLELRISESDYNSFLEEIQRSRELEFKTQEELSSLQREFTRASNDLELGYKARALQRQEQEDILKHQERIRQLELSERERLDALKRTQGQLEDLERRTRQTESTLQEKTDLVSNILEQLEREEKDSEKLKEYRARAEDLLQKRAEDDYTRRKKPETREEKEYRKPYGEKLEYFGTFTGLFTPTIIIPLAGLKAKNGGLFPSIPQAVLGLAADVCFILAAESRKDKEDEELFGKDYVDESNKEANTLNNSGLVIWGASTLLGIGYDIHVYFHNRGIREWNRQSAIEPNQSENPPRNYSFDFNPLERKMMLTYNF